MNKPRHLANLYFGLLLILLGGCDRSIEMGQYGPFSIGDSKQQTLGKLVDESINDVRPLPYTDIYVDDPTREQLNFALESSGVLVWIQHHPFPLRIEFDGELLTRTWPEIESNSHSPKEMQQYQKELARLQGLLSSEDNKADVIDTLLSFDSPFTMTIGNFIPGYQEYHRTGIPRPWSKEYELLLLSNDAWQFDGLDDLIWYDPYYSKVTLFFRDEKLERIEHEAFPFELP